MVSEGTEWTIEEIMGYAVKSGAFEDNSDEEAGDDQFLVRFGDGEQKFYDHDGLAAELREQSGDQAVE